eukprot:NODE_2226_length_621_cov_309.123482_g2176_i0.p2 GENE.NODE_2226_length_621_cov_309.123482_g2176_i0~~NODE_2226_length_621_cov_309.123482_g2176_i0.p2  ORF type:complete len:154 (+),score=38.14 NODE_2226_length_621_cov_309.123482_g2176_i0:77-538(+)
MPQQTRKATRNPAACVKDVSHADFISAAAAQFKREGQLELPKNWEFQKMASWKQYSPYDQDWFYIRTASLLRRLYVRGGTGIGGLQKHYGGARKRGVCPVHHADASAGVIRHCLHQLENKGLVEHDENGGRRVSKSGRKMCDQIAQRVLMEEK